MIASFWNKLWSSVTSKCTFWFTSRTSGLTMSTFPIPLLHFDWCSFSSVGSKNIFPQFEHGQVLNWKKKTREFRKSQFHQIFQRTYFPWVWIWSFSSSSRWNYLQNSISMKLCMQFRHNAYPKEVLQHWYVRSAFNLEILLIFLILDLEW